jgi:hypothetical protein
MRWGIDGLESGQIEGRIASRADWALTAEVAFDLACHWDGLEAPLEEILPCTVMDSLGSGRMSVICHIYWDRGASVRSDDMIDPQDLPRHVCMIKRFRRDPLAIETLIVGTSLGRSLLLATQRAAPGSKEDLNIEMLLRAFLAQVEARREPILHNPGRRLLEAPGSAPLDVISVRQICGLDGGIPEVGEPYLYFENTGSRLQISVHAADLGKVCVACLASPDQESAEISLGLQGYLCLPAPKARLLKLSGRIEGGSVEEVVHKIVWGDEGYFILPAFSWTVGDDEFVAEYRVPKRKQASILCLPLYAGQKLDVEILWERRLSPV